MRKDIEQGNRIERSKVNPFAYMVMIFDEGAKTFKCGKGHSFLTNNAWKLDIHMQKNNMLPVPYTLY